MIFFKCRTEMHEFWYSLFLNKKTWECILVSKSNSIKSNWSCSVPSQDMVLDFSGGMLQPIAIFKSMSCFSHGVFLFFFNADTTFLSFCILLELRVNCWLYMLLYLMSRKQGCIRWDFPTNTMSPLTTITSLLLSCSPIYHVSISFSISWSN